MPCFRVESRALHHSRGPISRRQRCAALPVFSELIRRLVPTANRRSEARALTRPNRRPDEPPSHRTAGAAAARRRRVPAHGDPAVRRSREVDPRARPGDGRPTSRSCWSRRSRPTSTIRARRTCTTSAPRDDAAAAEAARRHRQGAGRRRASAPRSRSSTTGEYFSRGRVAARATSSSTTSARWTCSRAR